ncbi:hypothetical protein GTZ93_00375 [Corallococcus exiguus]|uniref:Endonuclease/exonuclease/phosphatase domain-containing protein n=1 Tax=Corallococcus exiguus TaxID=83462 RepID=A0A7X4Y419_9BACT|nr:endonuclease/exonuclease/phosphatase family protein [Corallococcus exiguus]NBC38268.1 hypothetical protein [Corallococcus exiguus]
MSQSSFLGTSSADETGRYDGTSASTSLESHGVAKPTNTVDVVFLQEVKGELNETLKLIEAHGGKQVTVNHPSSVAGECGLAAVWRAGAAHNWTVTQAAYRELVAVTMNGVPVFLFGGHAKSGGGHDTQLDVARLLMAAQAEIQRPGLPSFIALLVGDMNTEPAFQSADGTAMATRAMKIVSGGAELFWQAVSPGIATHDDNTLDFAWVCSREAPPFRVTPYLPSNPAVYQRALRALSDHVPVGFLVDLPKTTVL